MFNAKQQKKLERLLAQISSDDDDDDDKFVTPTNSKKGTKHKAPPLCSPSRSPSCRSPPRSKQKNRASSSSSSSSSMLAFFSKNPAVRAAAVASAGQRKRKPEMEPAVLESVGPKGKEVLLGRVRRPIITNLRTTITYKPTITQQQNIAHHYAAYLRVYKRTCNNV